MALQPTLAPLAQPAGPGPHSPASGLWPVGPARSGPNPSTPRRAAAFLHALGCMLLTGAPVAASGSRWRARACARNPRRPCRCKGRAAPALASTCGRPNEPASRGRTDRSILLGDYAEPKSSDLASGLGCARWVGGRTWRRLQRAQGRIRSERRAEAAAAIERGRVGGRAGGRGVVVGLFLCREREGGKRSSTLGSQHLRLSKSREPE